VYVAFTVSPRKRVSAPATPAVAEVTNSGNCQHSRTEEPLRVAMAVRLRDGVVMLLSWAAVKASALMRLARRESFMVIYSAKRGR